MSDTRAPGTGFALERAAVLAAAMLTALVLLVHGTGWLLAVITGHRTPTLDAARASRLLAGQSYVPGTPLVAHAALMLVAFSLIGSAIWRIGRWRQARAASPKARAAAFDARPGFASPAAVRRAASVQQLNAQATHLRPSLTKPKPRDVGYWIGTSRGQDVWVSCERSVLTIGPSRSGKGVYLVINAILDAPGAVITTATKPDNIKATITARAQRGPVGAFDPQGMLPATYEHAVSWDAVAGCEDPMRAATRAAGLANNTGIAAGSENRIWRQHATTVIETVLHAAALQGLDIEVAFRWMQSEHALAPAIAILEHHPDACPTWDDRLRGIAHNPDPRFVGSVMSVVAAAIAPLAFPTVRAALTPSPDRPAITAESLLADNLTLYCLATDSGAAATATVVSALIEDIAYVARRTAARSPGGRLDPPPLFMLDECANTAPIPSLPILLADGSGQGLTIWPVFQTIAQMRSKYGDDDAQTVFSTSQVKLVLGGTDTGDDVRDLSALIGERDEHYSTVSRSALALAFDTKATESGSLRRIPILPPEAIRTIPLGSALMLQSQAEPMPLRMRAWFDRPDARELKAHEARVETDILALALAEHRDAA